MSDYDEGPQSGPYCEHWVELGGDPCEKCMEGTALVKGLRAQLAAARACIEAADSLTMIHRANRMAGSPTPALDSYDAARRAFEELAKPDTKPAPDGSAR